MARDVPELCWSVAQGVHLSLDISGAAMRTNVSWLAAVGGVQRVLLSRFADYQGRQGVSRASSPHRTHLCFLPCLQSLGSELPAHRASSTRPMMEYQSTHHTLHLMARFGMPITQLLHLSLCSFRGHQWR